jgi:hypothetical protein
MASLLNQPINTSYEGLVKFTDNAAISATSKALTDGAGNLLPVEVSTTGMTYSGTQDFSGATVVGIGGGAPTVMESYIAPHRPGGGGWNFGASWASPFPVYQNQTLTEMNIRIHTAFAAGATASFYLYNGQHRSTPVVNAMVVPYQKVATLATGVAVDVTGEINVSLTPYTTTYTGVMWLYVVVTDTTGLWQEGQSGIADGNGWYQFLQAYNPFNENTAVAPRRGYTGANAGAPATLPADETGGVGDIPRSPFFWFKYN